MTQNKIEAEKLSITPETDANAYGGSTFLNAPDTVRLVHADLARKLEIERDEYRRIAGELVAAIKVNTMRGTFATATIEDVEQWLKQWTDQFGSKTTFCPTNARYSESGLSFGSINKIAAEVLDSENAKEL